MALSRMIALAVCIAGCSPSDVLTVPPPSGDIPSTGIQSKTGGESLLSTGAFYLFQGLFDYNSDNSGVEGTNYLSQEDNGLVFYSGLLADEFSWADATLYPSAGATIDARQTTAAGSVAEWGDFPLERIMLARVTLQLAIPILRQYEGASGRPLIGEAYAFIAYAELFVAEDYCAGVPLSTVVPGGGVQYGMPLTSDSLWHIVESDFDSAVAYAGGVDSVANLARIGLARAHLDRGDFAAADSATQAVPTSYVYNVRLQNNGTVAPHATDQYDAAFLLGTTWWNVADRDGGNGMNFVSAGDPRLVIDSTLLTTYDGGPLYYPVKFGTQGATAVTLASGVEARLIAAEAALHAGNVGAWTSELNALRAAQPMPILTADSTTTASDAMRVDVMFRERAFWLFGNGTRLGDLRRLVRQYGRAPNTVYPTGPYPEGQRLQQPIPNYGTDIQFPLPTPLSGTVGSNPNYHSCLNRNA